MGIRRQGHLLGAISMDGIETLTAVLEQNADQIDQDPCVTGGSFHRRSVAQIGLHCMDLANTAERLKKAGQLRSADSNPDAKIPLGQSAHHVPAQKTRAAIDSDQGVIGAACGHAALNFLPGRDASKPGKYRISQPLYRAKPLH